MKISIITVAYNSAETIARSLESVQNQRYPNIEHIVVDGQSKDRTLEVVSRYPHVAQIISEPDEGIYDAMNKGIRMATGDYVGTLNADDMLHHPDTIADLVGEIQRDRLDGYFADIRFVYASNPSKTLRYYSSAAFHPRKFALGYMPAHPSVYFKRTLFDTLGYYKTDYQIASDYELLIRFLYRQGISHRYLPLLMVDMLPGGVSTKSIRSRYILNKEIVRACAENGIKTNMLKVSLKYFNKVGEYFKSGPVKA